MILDKVYQAAGSGVAGVGTALKLVLSELHKVLYKQLLAWLLQGNLYDPFNEFFIVKDDKGRIYLFQFNLIINFLNLYKKSLYLLLWTLKSLTIFANFHKLIFFD